MEDKIIFNVDNVNITDIMEQIYKRIESRGYNVNELKSLNDFKIKPFSSSDVPESSELSVCAERVLQTAAVQYWWVMPKQVGFINSMRIFRYKVMRKLTFFYMKHVVDQQNIFNANAANTINLLSEKNDSLEHENKELNERISLLTEEVEEIKKILRQ